MGQEGASATSEVGILTFHRCVNYGSYWQARCLAEGIQARGKKALILDHVCPKASFAELRCALRPTLPIPVNQHDREQYACKVRKFFSEFEKLPLSARFDLDHPETMPPVETVVIGSDEVWNLRHPWFGCRPAFFGEGLQPKRKVAYAASFGNYSCWEGIGSPWTAMLRELDDISVRDENSWWMLKNCVGIESEIVLDPCLQFPVIPEGTWNGPDWPFVLVYGHNFSQEFASQVRHWARAKGLRLLSIGYRNDSVDGNWIAADPHDFAHAVAQCEAVATNFFHGCVFALRNEKPFACELSPYRSIKVRGLMELLGTQERLVSGDGQVETLLSASAEPRVTDRISELRQSSNEFIDRALGESHATEAA